MEQGDDGRNVASVPPSLFPGALKAKLFVAFTSLAAWYALTVTSLDFAND